MLPCGLEFVRRMEFCDARCRIRETRGDIVGDDAFVGDFEATGDGMLRARSRRSLALVSSSPYEQIDKKHQ